MLVQELVKQMKENPGLVEDMKENPEKALKAAVASTPLQRDVVVYRVVVYGLSGALLLCIGGSILLSFFGKVMPEGVLTLGAAAGGALAGLLAPSPSRT